MSQTFPASSTLVVRAVVITPASSASSISASHHHRISPPPSIARASRHLSSTLLGIAASARPTRSSLATALATSRLLRALPPTSASLSRAARDSDAHALAAARSAIAQAKSAATHGFARTAAVAAALLSARDALGAAARYAGAVVSSHAPTSPPLPAAILPAAAPKLATAASAAVLLLAANARALAALSASASSPPLAPKALPLLTSACVARAVTVNEFCRRLCVEAASCGAPLAEAQAALERVCSSDAAPAVDSLRARAVAHASAAWLERAHLAWDAFASQWVALADLLQEASHHDLTAAHAALASPSLAVVPSVGDWRGKRLAAAALAAARLTAELSALREKRAFVVDAAATAARGLAAADGQQMHCTAGIAAALAGCADAAPFSYCACSTCASLSTSLLDDALLDLALSPLQPPVSEELRKRVSLSLSPLPSVATLPAPQAVVLDRLPPHLRARGRALAVRLHAAEFHRGALCAPAALAELSRLLTLEGAAAATGAPLPLSEAATRVVLAALAYCAPLGVVAAAGSSEGAAALRVLGVSECDEDGSLARPADLVGTAAAAESLTADERVTSAWANDAWDVSEAPEGSDSLRVGAGCHALASRCDAEERACALAREEGVRWADVATAVTPDVVAAIATVEATANVPLGEALTVYDTAVRDVAAGEALVARVQLLASRRVGLLRARPSNADAEEADVGAAEAALTARRLALRGAVAELDAALAHHAATRAGALDSVARLLRGVSAGAAAFTGGCALAPLRGLVEEVAAAEALAAELARELLGEARRVVRVIA